MAQQSRVGEHKTHIYNKDGRQIVRYHTTDVVSYNAENIILNSGGWRTSTTKSRMNQASAEFGLGFGVYQKDSAWIVRFGGNEEMFEDGMALDRRNHSIHYQGSEYFKTAS